MEREPSKLATPQKSGVHVAQGKNTWYVHSNNNYLPWYQGTQYVQQYCHQRFDCVPGSASSIIIIIVDCVPGSARADKDCSQSEDARHRRITTIYINVQKSPENTNTKLLLYSRVDLRRPIRITPAPVSTTFDTHPPPPACRL